MRILIVSGAGLLAGTYLYNQLVKELVNLDKFKKDSEFPEIVLYNYPFKSIKEDGCLNEELAIEELSAIFNKFNDVDHIVIACNTFHVLSFENKKVLSLTESVLNEFNEQIANNKKGLVLCSTYSREKKLFDSKNLNYSDYELSILINKVIANNIHSYNNYVKDDFNLLNLFIKKNNITHLVIGCTELSLVDWQNIVDIPVIDSTKLVINKLIKEIERI